MDRRVDALSTPANHILGDDTAETMPTAMSPQTSYELPHGSPFKLKPEDVESLAQSGGFAILRDHLAEYYNYEYANFKDYRLYVCSKLTVNTDSANTMTIPHSLLSTS